VNKSELVELVAEKTEMSKKDSEKAVKAVLDSITDGLVKGDKVQLVGFGTFEVRNRKEREGRNPATGEKIKIKALNVPAFKPGKALKEKVK
jgi:DNA-binding protein HU-beta